METNKFTLMQWNILAKIYATNESFPNVNENYLKWEYRNKLILNILSTENPDIFCLEEVNDFELVKNDILNKLNNKYEIIFEIRNDNVIGNIIALNKELFKLINYTKINLMKSENDDNPQICLIANIQYIKTNKEFFIICTHLKAKKIYENERIIQMKTIIDYLNKNNIKNFIFCGDFNTEPNSDVIKLISNYSEGIESCFDYDELKYTTYKIRKTNEIRIIDYIFYQKKFFNKINCYKAKPTINEKIGLPNEIFPSDHLYLKTEFNFI